MSHGIDVWKNSETLKEMAKRIEHRISSPISSSFPHNYNGPQHNDSLLQKYLLWLHALRSAYKFVKQKTPEEQSLRLRYASLAPRASPAKFSLCHDDGSTFFPCKRYLAKSGKEELFLFYSCDLFKGASYISFSQKSYN